MAISYTRSTFVCMLLSFALATATYSMTAVSAEILNKKTSDGCSLPNPPLGIKVPECVATLMASFSAYAATWGPPVVNLGCSTSVSGSLNTVQFTTVTCQMSPFQAGPYGSAWSSYVACPVNSTDQGATCLCNAGTVADQPNYACVQNTCPIPVLTSPLNDPCTAALENFASTQAQKEAACGTLTPAMQSDVACLNGKLAALRPPIPLAITANIRSLNYQAHLREVWDKMEEIVALMDENSTARTACVARRAEIAAEKGCDNAGPCTSCYGESAAHRSHCIVSQPAPPSPNTAQHTQGRAIDVSEAGTINPLRAILGNRRPPETIQQFLDAATPANCNLIWGGTWTGTSYDPVHFLAR